MDGWSDWFSNRFGLLCQLDSYQFGQVLLYGKPITSWTLVAVLLLVTMIYFVVRKPRQIKDKIITLENLQEANS